MSRTPGKVGAFLACFLLCGISMLLLAGKCNGGKDAPPNLPPIEDEDAEAGPKPVAPITRPDSFAGIIKKVKDIVVTIKPKQIVTERPHGFPFSFFNPYDYPARKKVLTGLGSGFIIDKTGLVVTNNHVIKGASEVIVQLQDRREFPAGLVGKDVRLDIAVLQIPEPVSQAAVLGDSDKIEVGDWVIAIGNPMGLANTVTAGIVSAKGRSSWDLLGEIPGYADFMQTDASINPGNSGGPLVNLGSEVVGVNSAKMKEGQGIGFAIPINMVKQILPQLIKNGHITRAWMGIYIAPVDAEIAKRLKMSVPLGALIAEVIEDGPAHEAGFENADVVLEFGGQKIENPGKLPWIIATSSIGESIKVKIMRAGKEKELEVVLRPMPE